MKYRQEIIRDKDYNIIETIDNDIHVRYNSNNDIIYYKVDNFEYPSFKITNLPREQEFIDLLKDGVIKIDKFGDSNSIFLIKNDKCLFEYDLKVDYIWFNNELVWSEFKIKYSMNYRETREFLTSMVEKHFNCINVIPINKYGKYLLVNIETF